MNKLFCYGKALFCWCDLMFVLFFLTFTSLYLSLIPFTSWCIISKKRRASWSPKVCLHKVTYSTLLIPSVSYFLFFFHSVPSSPSFPVANTWNTFLILPPLPHSHHRCLPAGLPRSLRSDSPESSRPWRWVESRALVEGRLQVVEI